MSRKVCAAFGLLWLDRLSRSEEDQKTVRGTVFPTNDVACLQGWGQLGLDVEIEQVAVDRAVDDPRGIEAVMAEGRDESLRLPVAEGRMIDQPFAARRPTSGLGHVGLDGGFVNKSNPRQQVGHEGLTAGDPDVARGGDLGALLFGGLQVFFCASGRGHGAAARPSRGAPWCHAWP